MILALSNSKGGVGKTTIAVHLAIWLVEQGYDVAFVDADAQESSSKWLDKAAGKLKLKRFRLKTADDILLQLPQIRKEAQFVIVDGPAGLSEVTRSLFYCADLAILPCPPSPIDIEALLDGLKVVRQLKYAEGGRAATTIIVPNRLQRHYRLSRELLALLKSYGFPMGEGLSLRQAYVDAAIQKTVVWRMSDESARQAAGEIQFLFQQLLAYVTAS